MSIKEMIFSLEDNSENITVKVKVFSVEVDQTFLKVYAKNLGEILAAKIGKLQEERDHLL